MGRETITFKGEKELWQKFTFEVKRQGVEIWGVLEPFLKRYVRFDRDKIKQCTIAALKEYNEDRITELITVTNEVSDTDGNFVQVGKRVFIDITTFSEDKDSVHRSPILPSLGRMIADGERDYILHTILKHKKVVVESIKEPDDLLNFISNEAHNLGFNVTVFLSVEFMTRLYNNRHAHTRLKGSYVRTLDDSINIVIIPEKFLGKKIVILEKSSGVLSYMRRYNPITDKMEILQLDIGLEERDEKTEVLAKTLVKYELFEPKRVKIFEIQEAEEKKV